MKQCSKCMDYFTLLDFSKSKKAKDGLSSWCKGCTRKYNAERWQEAKRVQRQIPASKLCPVCGCWKPSDRFRFNPLSLDGLMGECSECNRSRALERKFGINAETYDKLLFNQGGVCAICKEICNTGRSLAVDHDHRTNKVRGLLCSKCNRSLGMMNDSIDQLKEAIRYLEEANG